MQKLLDNIWTWRMFSGEKRYFFNGWLIRLPEGDLIVDPPPVSHELYLELPKLRPLGILLTNWTHRRFAADIIAARPMPLMIHALDAEKLEQVKADRFVDETTVLAKGLNIVATPGKTRGEIGLSFENAAGKILILGDTVIGHPAGELGLLPDAKIEDKPALLRTLQKIDEMEFDYLLVGDGESLLVDAKRKFREFVAQPRVIPIGPPAKPAGGC